MKPENKMRDALRTLRKRLDPKVNRSVRQSLTAQPLCQARLDRLGIATSEVLVDAILQLPGFRRNASHWLKRRNPKDFLPYGRATRITSGTSICELVILSERQSHRLPQYRITMIADDLQGLRCEDVRTILELLPNVRLVLLELAFDFSPGSRVDGAFIRAHGLFGKSRRRRVGEIRAYDSWGARRGATKFVRSYAKAEVRAHRLELQLGASMLQKLEIADIFNFQKLTKLLNTHLLFAELDEQKVIARLRNDGFSATQTINVLRKLEDHSDDLSAQRSVLRRFARMTNIRRMMVPLRENRLLEHALLKWLAEWPSAPAGLGGKK